MKTYVVGTHEHTQHMLSLRNKNYENTTPYLELRQTNVYYFVYKLDCRALRDKIYIKIQCTYMIKRRRSLHPHNFWIVLIRIIWWLLNQSVLDDRCLTINVCGRARRGPVCGFLVFWLHIAIEPFAFFHHSVFNYKCSLWCFKDYVEDPFADWTSICNLALRQN